MHAQPYLFLPAVFLLLIFLGTISVYEDGWNYFSAATTTHLAKVSAKVRNFHCPHQEVPFPLGSRRMNCSDIDKYITVTDILLGKGKLKKVSPFVVQYTHTHTHTLSLSLSLFGSL